jgi:hypothetical protein
MRRSTACFHELVRSHDLNALERDFLWILAHALWESAIELDGTPAPSKPALSSPVALRPLPAPTPSDADHLSAA